MNDLQPIGSAPATEDRLGRVLRWRRDDIALGVAVTGGRDLLGGTIVSG